MTSKHAWKVELLSWDHLSPEHIQRLYDQRVACGWREDEVPQYVESAKQGGKIFYWVVLSDAVPDRGELIERHVTRYPKEASSLQDTGVSIRGVPRKPTNIEFCPIGHVALDIHDPEEDATHGLPDRGVVWMHQLYISYALQSGGFGSAAVAKAEEVASQETMNGNLMVLDTMAEECQMHPEFLAAMFTSKGNATPKISNQAWYTKMGYEVFGKQEIVKDWEARPGFFIDLSIVFLSKHIGRNNYTA